MLPIREVIKRYNVKEDDLYLYGNYMCKINHKFNTEINRKSNLILVTSTNPTPKGEGKTTMSIGINDSLNKLGYNSIASLREPSLGPVFGIKGGATGGGLASIEPKNEINLHFTGDMHAITSANNLISALIDNHIYFGNKLGFKKVVFNRCLDVNDRVLRNVKIGLNLKEISVRDEIFDITAASEIMSVFCLSDSIDELKNNINNILIGYNHDDKPLFMKDLEIVDSILALLLHAMNPNFVQSLYNNPVLIHGGPFANIAHGCSSIISTKLALRMSDYVITEAGFGADLGFEKFMNIKARKYNLKPMLVVIATTIKSLKYHGGQTSDNCDMDSLIKGSSNLIKHINNILEFNLNCLVVINKFDTDTYDEIEYIKNISNKLGVKAIVSTSYKDGEEGSLDVAEYIVNLCENNNQKEIKYTYEINDSITEKINKVCTKIYGASNVEYSDIALQKIKEYEVNGYNNIPVCIAKTQYSLSSDKNNLICDKPYNIYIRDINVKTGAAFLVVLTEDTITMPGLSKVPNAYNIKIIDDKITGIN